MTCVHPKGMKTLTALRVQELFTAEPAENAENTQWLSELGVLGGERLLDTQRAEETQLLSPTGV